jgi:DNA polymerase I-like protein with 3'-5' exonuclease and polymerase domains
MRTRTSSFPRFLEDLDPQVYLGNNYIVVDLEVDTSHGDYGHAVHPDNQILLACYRLGPGHPSYDGGKMHAVWGGEYKQDRLVELIEEADFLVAHNAKYELGHLRRCGLDLRNTLVFDTKLAEYVLLGNLAAGDKNMRGRSTSLDACVRRRGGPIKDPVVDKMLSMGINPTEIPRAWLQGRCEQDVRTTEELFLDQRRALKNTNRLPVLYTRCLTTPVLADIEFEGMALDPEAVEKEYEAALEQYAALERQMEQMTGGLNWRSSKQIAEYLYDVLGFDEIRKPSGEPRRTKAGARMTDQKTLDALVAKTPEQKAFLALRQEIGKVNAALVKNLHFFRGVVKEKGGVFHAVFNQTATATHRLSSSGIETWFEMFGGYKKVQFQNLPRQFKPLIKAKRPGWKIGEWDGSQLEFRVAAELGRDKQAHADILSKHDVHKFTGAVLFRAPKELLKNIADSMPALQALMPEVTKEQRQDSKQHTFKPLYGGSSGTKREQAYYAAFRARYSELEATQKGWVYEVVRTKRLVTPWGMRYYWPYAKMGNDGYCNVTSAVYNYPVQALATAEIIPIALVYFWHRLRERGLEDYIKLVNTVHDSVVSEVHPDYEREFERLAVDVWHDVYCYLREVYGMEFSVPLGTEVNLGSHWAASGNYTKAYDVFPDGTVRES